MTNEISLPKITVTIEGGSGEDITDIVVTRTHMTDAALVVVMLLTSMFGSQFKSRINSLRTLTEKLNSLIVEKENEK